MNEFTLLDYVDQLIARRGGKLIFACPNFAVVQTPTGEVALHGPASRRDWREQNERIIAGGKSNTCPVCGRKEG